MTRDVVDLLNDGIRLLFFNGVNDLICNHVGNEIAVENFQWKYQGEFQTSKRYGWKSPSKGQLGGYMREYQNLMYLKVLGAGHMVPMDLPDVSLDMMRNFVFGNSFSDYEQGLVGSKKGNGGQNCPVSPANTGCEACPLCPDESDKAQDPDDSSSIREEHPPVTITLPVAQNQIVAGFVISSLAVAICMCWLLGCCRRKKDRTALHYDMELPTTTSSYADTPDENGEFS